METLVRYLPSLNEVGITCEVYIDWDDITFPSDNLHVDGIPTTLSAEEIEFILSLKYPELLDAMNWTMSGILSVDVRIWIEIWWVRDDSNDQLLYCILIVDTGPIVISNFIGPAKAWEMSLMKYFNIGEFKTVAPGEVQ